MFRNQYDTDITTWSPAGRVFQVEYGAYARTRTRPPQTAPPRPQGASVGTGRAQRGRWCVNDAPCALTRPDMRWVGGGGAKNARAGVWGRKREIFAWPLALRAPYARLGREIASRGPCERKGAARAAGGALKLRIRACEGARSASSDGRRQCLVRRPQGGVLLPAPLPLIAPVPLLRAWDTFRGRERGHRVQGEGGSCRCKRATAWCTFQGFVLGVIALQSGHETTICVGHRARAPEKH